MGQSQTFGAAQPIGKVMQVHQWQIVGGGGGGGGRIAG